MGSKIIVIILNIHCEKVHYNRGHDDDDKNNNDNNNSNGNIDNDNIIGRKNHYKHYS